MSDDDLILGVAPAAEFAGELDPALEEPAPLERERAPAVLGDGGRQVFVGVLRMEGELVRNLRGVPAEEPEAWRWTDEEIDALMPALEGLAERYGVAETINEHAPQAGAALAIVMHANRSIAAERAWRAAHQSEPAHDLEEPPVDPEPAHVPEPDPVDAPAAESGAGGGAVDLARVASHIGPERLRGGAE